jgi:tetratricopeptide (TPR) repeat protein
LYAAGQLDAAAARFREAIRLDSEFSPAVFYLGACYAAGGKDREAAAAWQTTLVSDTGAAFVYTLLADALLRQREIDRTIRILDEASARWPEHPDIEMRRGVALAMNGKGAEALRALDRYLADRPNDADRLFLALHIIYNAHAAGGTIGTADEDRARFDKYAAAYLAAAGPQASLVEQWRKFMARRPGA